MERALTGPASRLRQAVPFLRVASMEASLRFCVDGLGARALHREAAARGLSPTTPYVGNRMWVTTLTDPDPPTNGIIRTPNDRHGAPARPEGDAVAGGLRLLSHRGDSG